MNMVLPSKEAKARQKQVRSLCMAMIIVQIVNELYISEVYDYTERNYIMKRIERVFMCENHGDIEKVLEGGLK